ncbi:hypothetical protein P175DRAFT_0526139 [Aspergillus ochraceoroseus IBT 24754]|uniref:Thioester reductase (TE) domain-containing protein n=2 Tax=Aspergillus ochraceoroseus TaxID=138278 RepID=A0A2T5LQ39_9EURO|nr:uncharacterized protein P175DRAFT_0526139 [Aspergillus ochraceoroseus IBT 24754]KKK19444.1 hypothetical protein AOCH_005650 [Aspergillus ochraceoroseus]PTU18389.1 hypothetical protein P175DRAFT_0526139 [Aspergillus ochraceoroseus IBT 24754]
MTSLFLTGATGYVGGQVLQDLTRSHHQYKIAALIRDEEVAKKVTSAFPDVRPVIASLDDSAVIEEEASKATIVLNLASNKHLGSWQAIQRGLAKRSSPSYWVQISGASAIAVGELASPSYTPGQPSDTVFDDLDGIAEIRSLVRAHPARAVDNFLLDVAKQNPSIKTAIVMPPIIYGIGEGPVNQCSIQIPILSKRAMERGKAIRLGSGQGRWGNIHVRDLGSMIAALALAGAEGKADAPLWNDNGIYLSGVGEITWAEISERIGKAACEKGFIPTSEVEEIDEAEADKLLPAARVFFASNARSKVRRAAELLGWKPVHEDLQTIIPQTVQLEAEKLGKA